MVYLLLIIILLRPLDDWLTEMIIMTRGIASPLVQLYTASYLCRVGLRAHFLSGRKMVTGNSSNGNGIFSESVKKSLPEYLKVCIDDFFLISRQCEHLKYDKISKDDGITLSSYIRLFIPALEWIFQCISTFTSITNTTPVVVSDLLKAADGHPNCDLIINCLLSAFPSYCIIEISLDIAHALSEIKRPEMHKWMILKHLGGTMLNGEPSKEDCKQVFTMAWPSVMDLEPYDLLQCTEVWLEFAVKFLDFHYVKGVLKAIVNACSKSPDQDKITPLLHSLLSKFLPHIKDYKTLLSMSVFMKFLDCFSAKNNAKADACRLVVENFAKTPYEVLNDQQLIDSIMSLCKIWHDASVNYHSSKDVARQVAKSINQFVNRVDFQRDFEKLLQFYMDCRSSFVYLEETIINLILNVNRAVMYVLSIVKGSHTKRTLNFAKASVAFCFITIPSIDDPLKQLKLIILSAQTALVNGCIGQAEALFKLAITALAEVPISELGTDGRLHPTDAKVAELVSELCSALISLPDSPEQVALYIWQGLTNATIRFDWLASSQLPRNVHLQQGNASSGSYRIDALLAIVCALAALSQPKYIYRVEAVDSNDVLYGNDKRFLARVNELTTEVLNEVLGDLEDRSHAVLPPKKPSGHAISCHQHIVNSVASCLFPHLDMSAETNRKFAKQLLQLGGANNRRLAKLKEMLLDKNSKEAANLFDT